MNQDRSSLWDHLAEAMTSGLVTGVIVGITEAFLLIPERSIHHVSGKILSILVLPGIIYVPLSLSFNCVLLVVALILGIRWRTFRGSGGAAYYRALNTLFLLVFLTVFYHLDRGDQLRSTIDLMSPLSYAIMSLILSAAFLIITFSLARLSRRYRFATILLTVALPIVSVAALGTILFWQTMGHADVVESLARQPASIDRPANILLITIDTQRADFIGCYGNTRVRTPNINSLAREGVLAAYCIAQAPLTLPSHTSILTSTYPAYHGVHNNQNNAVSASMNTLAEVLRDHGYNTGAFVSVFLLGRQFGLKQGFDVFQDKPGIEYLLYQPFLKETAFSRIVLPHIPFRQYFLECWVEPATTNAIQWMVSQQDRPFFLWVHYFSPHGPYAPPFPYAIPYLRQMNKNVDGYLDVTTFTGESRISRKELERDRALYMGEVTYTDYNIGLLTGALRKLHLMDNTLIVLTADHGEAFGENNDIEHGKTLFDTNIHVPLVFCASGDLPEGKTMDGLCQSIDIMPTILDYAGVEGPDEMQGMSLLPYLMGRKRLPERNGYSEAMATQRQERRLCGIVTKHWKYVYAPLGTVASLYNTDEDPEEIRNLIHEKPEIARRMRENLLEFMAEYRTEGKSEQIELDEESRASLRALGYIQ